jgi:hypothetical protein
VTFEVELLLDGGFLSTQYPKDVYLYGMNEESTGKDMGTSSFDMILC